MVSKCQSFENFTVFLALYAVTVDCCCGDLFSWIS